MRSSLNEKLNQSATLRTALALLLVLVLAATAILAARLSHWTETRGQRIPLTDADGEDFTVRDDVRVWETDTRVDIFRASYTGADGAVTVNSDDGERLLAPGTEGSYRFTLENNGKLPLRYLLTFESWQEGAEEPLPVDVRIASERGDYLLGSAAKWADASQIGEARDEQELEAGKGLRYTLEWRWVFEEPDMDERDTALGDQTVAQPIVLGLRILTEAEQLGGESGGGRAWSLVNLICTVLTLAVGGYELYFYLRKHEDDAALSAEENERLMKRRQRKLWALIPAGAAVVTFLLTEDMRQPMTLIDRWTPLMVLILLVALGYGWTTRLAKKKEETVSPT